MARSPAHKFGQSIGLFVENAIERTLEDFSGQHGLYFDKQGNRSARSGRKVSWRDKFGNKHDLDFVLERGGSDEEIGSPAIFIEIAWRRYTRHSKNKAQEIQGAVLPLLEKYKSDAPSAAVVLAGEFTAAAIDQ